MDTPLTIDTASDREVGAGYMAAVNIEGMPPRRQYPLELKRRVVEETFAPGASVSVVARRHDLNANLVFEWRKQYRQGRLWNGKPEAAAKRVPVPALPAIREPSMIRVGVIDHEGEVHPLLPPAPPASPPPREAATPPHGGAAIAGRIEIELPNRIKVRVDGEVGERALTVALVVAKGLVV